MQVYKCIMPNVTVSTPEEATWKKFVYVCSYKITSILTITIYVIFDAQESRLSLEDLQ